MLWKRNHQPARIDWHIADGIVAWIVLNGDSELRSLRGFIVAGEGVPCVSGLKLGGGQILGVPLLIRICG